MKRTVRFSVFRGESKYVADCLDLPIVTQAETRSELTKNVEATLELYSEDGDLEAAGFAPKPFIRYKLETEN